MTTSFWAAIKAHFRSCCSPRRSECCNAPGLLESDSSAAFVAAPRTCAAAATPAGRVAPTAESILRVGFRCAAECLSRWHLVRLLAGLAHPLLGFQWVN